jgi:hypothetical protein
LNRYCTKLLGHNRLVRISLTSSNSFAALRFVEIWDLEGYALNDYIQDIWCAFDTQGNVLITTLRLLLQKRYLMGYSSLQRLDVADHGFCLIIHLDEHGNLVLQILVAF